MDGIETPKPRRKVSLCHNSATMSIQGLNSQRSQTSSASFSLQLKSRTRQKSQGRERGFGERSITVPHTINIHMLISALLHLRVLTSHRRSALASAPSRLFSFFFPLFQAAPSVNEQTS